MVGKLWGLHSLPVSSHDERVCSESPADTIVTESVTPRCHDKCPSPYAHLVTKRSRDYAAVKVKNGTEVLSTLKMK